MKNYLQSKIKPIHVYLLSAPVLLSLFYYHQSPEQFNQLFPALAEQEKATLYQQYWKFALFFILVAIIPAFYITAILKKSLADFGLGLGDTKFGLKLVGILLPFAIIPLIWVAAHLPDIRSEYPMAKILMDKSELFWQYELVYIFLYYIAWEFFFRGFLLFGLKEEFGATNAILISTISSCLIHLGKPEGETLGSIVVGILFGWIAVRTNSIWYVWILHFSIGVLTDLFVLMQMGKI